MQATEPPWPRSFFVWIVLLQKLPRTHSTKLVIIRDEKNYSFPCYAWKRLVLEKGLSVNMKKSNSPSHNEGKLQVVIVLLNSHSLHLECGSSLKICNGTGCVCVCTKSVCVRERVLYLSSSPLCFNASNEIGNKRGGGVNTWLRGQSPDQHHLIA